MLTGTGWGCRRVGLALIRKEGLSGQLLMLTPSQGHGVRGTCLYLATVSGAGAGVGTLLPVGPVHLEAAVWHLPRGRLLRVTGSGPVMVPGCAVAAEPGAAVQLSLRASIPDSASLPSYRPATAAPSQASPGACRPRAGTLQPL